MSKSKINLKKLDPSAHPLCKNKDDAEKMTHHLQKEMYDLLYLMYAQNKYSLLIILQGIDASGKDGTVKHVFAGANPQGVKVYSFKVPSPEELKHDFLWRCHLHAPESGLAVIFNRSYYEDVTKVMVHPDLLKLQHIPDEYLRRKDFFEQRYERINEFEKLLDQRGTRVVKFFLNISKKEQKDRLQDRLDHLDKFWKFSEEDIKERKYWNKFMRSYEKMIEATDTKHAPWYVIPSDHKWYRNLEVSKILVDVLKDMKMSYPKLTTKIKKVR